MRSQSVTLLQHTWGADEDGGAVLASTTSTTAQCSVFPGEPDLVLDESTMRWTGVTPYELHFSSDPSLNPRDEITWVDGGRSHNLVVAGVIDVSGRGITYQVNAVERV